MVIIKKILLIVISMVFLSSIVHCQTYMYDGTPYASIKADSVFDKFIVPDLPAVLFENACSYPGFIAYSFNVMCHVNVDTNHKVQKLSLFPLYYMGNTLPDTSYIWKEILSSIDSVSKLWIFKPILHKIDSSYSDDLKAYLQNINSGKTRANKLPFAGRQVHIFLLCITLPCWDIADPKFFYLLNVRPNKKE